MVDSASDERVVNNVARREYRVRTEAIKDKGVEFIALVQAQPACREYSLAPRSADMS
jgi:hypothetical protein